MKHIFVLSRPNAVPAKAGDLDGVIQFLSDATDLLIGILALITTKQDIAAGEL